MSTNLGNIGYHTPGTVQISGGYSHSLNQSLNCGRGSKIGYPAASIDNPFLLPSNGGYRIFRVREKENGAVISGARTALYEHNTLQQVGNSAGSLRLTDANGLIAYNNLNTNSKYLFVATHPSNSGYNVARLDLLAPNLYPAP